jgi:hypothetical protein
VWKRGFSRGRSSDVFAAHSGLEISSQFRT